MMMEEYEDIPLKSPPPIPVKSPPPIPDYTPNAIPNFNRMHGNSKDLENLQYYQSAYEPSFDKALLAQNPKVVQSLLATIMTKNTMDYPPLGPTTLDKQLFQQNKIDALIMAFHQKYRENYGTIGMGHTGLAGVNTASTPTWTTNTAKRISHAANSTYTNAKASAKALFGIKGGRRKKHRKTHRKRK